MGQTCCFGSSEEELRTGHARNISFWGKPAQGRMFKQQLASIALSALAAISPILMVYES